MNTAYKYVKRVQPAPSQIIKSGFDARSPTNDTTYKTCTSTGHVENHCAVAMSSKEGSREAGHVTPEHLDEPIYAQTAKREYD